MKKVVKFFVFLLVPTVSLLTPQTAFAVCPVCTVAVVAGLGLSRWLGFDDVISGIWIGGVLLSSSLWLASWLQKKYRRAHSIKYLSILVSSFIYLLVFIPLAWTDIIGHPFNRLWGVDKLVLGTIFGSAAFWAGTWLDKKIRKIRGKQLLKYQKVVFPVVLLLLLSVLSWIITKP
jgi:hypothetical protein